MSLPDSYIHGTCALLHNENIDVKAMAAIIMYYFIVCIITCTSKFNKYHRHIKMQSWQSQLPIPRSWKCH